MNRTIHKSKLTALQYFRAVRINYKPFLLFKTHVLSILYTGGPGVLYWGWVKTFYITTFFFNKYSSRGFFFLLKSCSHENCGNIFILYLFVEAKVKGYLNTPTVYTHTKKEKVSIHIKKSNGNGLFIFAFPMINDAPVHTWKLMANQSNISNSD